MERTVDDMHASAVDAWLIRASAGGSKQALLASFHDALAGIWARAARTLGQVTLDAVARQVLANAISRHHCFAPLQPAAGSGPFRCDELQLEQRLATASYGELVTGMRAVLLEVLGILGSMTADVLTPELHEELACAHHQQLEAGGTHASAS